MSKVSATWVPEREPWVIRLLGADGADVGVGVGLDVGLGVGLAVGRGVGEGLATGVRVGTAVGLIDLGGDGEIDAVEDAVADGDAFGVVDAAGVAGNDAACGGIEGAGPPAQATTSALDRMTTSSVRGGSRRWMRRSIASR
jgi:hypothetical protein